MTGNETATGVATAGLRGTSSPAKAAAGRNKRKRERGADAVSAAASAVWVDNVVAGIKEAAEANAEGRYRSILESEIRKCMDAERWHRAEKERRERSEAAWSETCREMERGGAERSALRSELEEERKCRRDAKLLGRPGRPFPIPRVCACSVALVHRCRQVGQSQFGRQG